MIFLHNDLSTAILLFIKKLFQQLVFFILSAPFGLLWTLYSFHSRGFFVLF
jgi:hypothetical protein